MSDYVDRCPTCFAILLDTPERINNVGTLLQGLGAISGAITKENVLDGIRLLGSYAWTEDPILTPKGLSGIDYTGNTRLKASQFKELQIELSRLEKEFVNWNFRTYFSHIESTDEDGYFLPKKSHLQQIRFSIYKILYVTGTSWEDYFTRDEHDVLQTTTNKEDFTDFANNDMSLMKHVKAIHIEDVRHGAIRWWRDRFRYRTDLHDAWGWHLDADTLRASGNTGSTDPSKIFIDEDAEDVRHQEIGLYGYLTGRSSYGSRFSCSGRLYRDNKDWSECLEDETEGKNEIYLESSASSNERGTGAACSSSLSMDWKPWNFRILREDKNPRVKLRNETNFFIKGKKVVDLYTSLSTRPLSQGYAYAAIYIDLALYDSNGDVYPIRYELQSNFNTPQYSASTPLIKANLDTFFLDNEHLIINGETLINHLNHYYGTSQTYYFCHSFRISTKTQAIAYYDFTREMAHTAYAKFSYFVKEVGLTSTKGLVCSVVNDVVPWDTNNGGSPVPIPARSPSALPFREYSASKSSFPVIVPVPEEEREREPVPANAPSPDGGGKQGGFVPQPGDGPNPPVDLPWENPPLPTPPPTEEERYAYVPSIFVPIGTVLLNLKIDYLREVIVNSYITLQTISNYIDIWYENINTGVYERIEGNDLVGDSSPAISESDENYAELRQQYGSLIEDELNLNAYEILGYQLTEEDEILVTIGGWLAGATYPLIPLCNNWTSSDGGSTYYGTVEVPLSYLTKDNQRLYELIDEEVPTGLDFDALRDAFGKLMGMPDDALGVFMNRGLNYAITYPNGEIQYLNYKNAELGSGGAAEVGNSIFVSPSNMNYTTLDTVADTVSAINSHLGTIPQSTYDSVDNIGTDIVGNPWDMFPDVGAITEF